MIGAFIARRFFNRDASTSLRVLIEKEFLKDLVAVSALTAYGDERTEMHEEHLRIMREKYQEGCPSPQYPWASHDARAEYDRIHNNISELLYN